jgi:glycine cleavage system H protein
MLKDNFMSQIYFTKDHEWIAVNDKTAIVGITNHAQEQLGDLVFVDLPKVGKKITQGESCLVVESVKAASDVYAPADGDITEVNNALENDPSLINNAPHSDGWLWKMTLSNVSQLTDMMSEDEYKNMIG